jgi:hypothetical protein
MKEDSWVFRYIALTNDGYGLHRLGYKDLDTCSVFSDFIATTFLLGIFIFAGFFLSMGLTLGVIGLGAWIYLDLSWAALLEGPYGEFVVALLVIGAAVSIGSLFLFCTLNRHNTPKALQGVASAVSDLKVLIGARLSKVCFKIELDEAPELEILKQTKKEQGRSEYDSHLGL